MRGFVGHLCLRRKLADDLPVAGFRRGQLARCVQRVRIAKARGDARGPAFKGRAIGAHPCPGRQHRLGQGDCPKKVLLCGNARQSSSH